MRRRENKKDVLMYKEAQGRNIITGAEIRHTSIRRNRQRGKGDK